MFYIVPIAFLTAAVILCGYTNIRLPVKRKNRKLHIACVGDSITYGCTLPLFFLHRYPAVLQRLLGQNVQVAAFGVNDRTLQNTGNKPYRKKKAFRESLHFQPDIAVILLGTNDSKDNNWISAEAFRQQYKELIFEYQELDPCPRILICTPPCAFKPINRFFYLTNDANIACIPEIAKEVQTLAAEMDLEIIDLYAGTVGHRELFGPDGLHPNAAGARAIAEEISHVLNKTPEHKSMDGE